MKFRRIASLTVFLAFIMLAATGTILYITPQGRVAYWAGWTLGGFSKTQWTALHINLGLLFLIGSVFHIYFNWKPIITYLRNRTRHLVVFTREFVSAAVICLVFILATSFGMPPFKWMLDLNESIKNDASAHYGEPPYGHAELSTLETFTRRVDLELGDALERLDVAGFSVESASQTLEDIATKNHTTPQTLFLAMCPATDRPPDLPRLPVPGTGRQRLADLCEAYRLSISEVVKALSVQKIEAAPHLTLKEISEKNGTSPDQIYEAIRRSVER